MRKIALIPVRLGSTRLPGKALKCIQGKPLITHLIDRIKQSRTVDSIVLCTTQLEEDDALLEVAIANGVEVFRGDEEDLLIRLRDAMRYFDADLALQVDGDDPLCDPYYMRKVMAELEKDTSLDVVYCDGIPLGMASKAITKPALEEVCKNKTTTETAHGHGYYLIKSDFLKVKKIPPESSAHVHSESRITIDYQEDIDFLDKLLSKIDKDSRGISIDEIVTCLNSNPDIVNINAFRNDEYWERTHTNLKSIYEN